MADNNADITEVTDLLRAKLDQAQKAGDVVMMLGIQGEILIHALTMIRRIEVRQAQWTGL